mmetsp:Transcript_40087/g.40882  ORF Transcript_40087/g.40882 Transcript_40087/m.40882 type:complete len:261 (-) Transcript_40087:30-812(-)
MSGEKRMRDFASSLSSASNCRNTPTVDEAEKIEKRTKFIRSQLDCMTEDQLTRFEFFFRSHFNRNYVKELLRNSIAERTRKDIPVTNEMAIVVCGLSKLFVGELIETAIDSKARETDTEREREKEKEREKKEESETKTEIEVKLKENKREKEEEKERKMVNETKGTNRKETNKKDEENKRDDVDKLMEELMANDDAFETAIADSMSKDANSSHFDSMKDVTESVTDSRNYSNEIMISNTVTSSNTNFDADLDELDALLAL